MYRQIIKESRPFGSVEANVVSVECNGFVAVVQSIETVGPGTELKTVKKKNAPVPKIKVRQSHFLLQLCYSTSRAYSIIIIIN